MSIPNWNVLVDQGNFIAGSLGDHGLHYKLRNSDTWSTVTESGNWTVAISGGNMIAGSDGLNAGIWYRPENGDWSQPDDLISGDWNVAVSGGNFIAGSRDATGLWYKIGNDDWAQLTPLYQWNVAVSGINMIAGTFYVEDGNNPTGGIVNYKIGNDDWTSKDDIATGEINWNVAISGENMIVGSGDNSGFSYKFPSNPDWNDVETEGAWSVAIDGLYMIAGSQSGSGFRWYDLESGWRTDESSGYFDICVSGGNMMAGLSYSDFDSSPKLLYKNVGQVWQTVETAGVMWTMAIDGGNMIASSYSNIQDVYYKTQDDDTLSRINAVSNSSYNVAISGENAIVGASPNSTLGVYYKNSQGGSFLPGPYAQEGPGIPIEGDPWAPAVPDILQQWNWTVSISGNDMIVGYVGYNSGQTDAGVYYYQAPISCFLPNTKLQLSDGTYKQVQDLTLDDTLMSPFSPKPQQIKRILCTKTRTTLLPTTNLPIRVPAHHFGENRPSEDVYLSGHHRIITENNIGVQAYKLLSTDYLFMPPTYPDVEYYHIQLVDSDQHLIASGLPVESYSPTDI